MKLADAAVDMLRSAGYQVKVAKRPPVATTPFPGAKIYGRRIRIGEVLDKPYGLPVQVAMALWLLQQTDPPSGVIFPNDTSAIVQVSD